MMTLIAGAAVAIATGAIVASNPSSPARTASMVPPARAEGHSPTPPPPLAVLASAEGRESSSSAPPDAGAAMPRAPTKLEVRRHLGGAAVVPKLEVAPHEEAVRGEEVGSNGAPILE